MNLFPQTFRRNSVALVFRLAFATLMACAAVSAGAQGYPAMPVKIIVPFAPGGGTDTVARVVAAQLQEIWHQTVIVDYKPGAGTVIGNDFVARSAPDGYTIGLANSSLVVNPFLHSHMPFDTLKDLRPVTQVGFIQTALVARSGAPFDTVAGMIAYAKANPGRLTYGRSGVGSMSELTMELFKQRQGLDLVTIPFKGGSQVLNELMAGRLDIASDTFLLFRGHLQAGKIKMLGTFGETRIAGFEKLYPTVAETIPGLFANSLMGFVVPAATPDAVVHQIQLATAQALARPDVRKQLLDLGVIAVGSTPEDFDRLIRAEMARWGPVIKEAHISLD